ncbi:MAG TPA: STAS domain-containing protein [Micromonosporaceae bacterium]|nr:STAS domain-containing protein [Micromonosporaceae bacterium]
MKPDSEGQCRPGGETGAEVRALATATPIGSPVPAQSTADGVLTVCPLPGGAGLRVAGEVDMSSHDVLAEALDRLGGAGHVLLDLTELRFIDVGGVALLARTARRLRPHRRMVVLNAPPHFRRLVALLWGEAHAMSIHDDQGSDGASPVG